MSDTLNIDDLSTVYKCVLISKGLGWETKGIEESESGAEVSIGLYDHDGEFVTRFWFPAGTSKDDLSTWKTLFSYAIVGYPPNFYLVERAGLAWRVHLWAVKCDRWNIAVYYDGWWGVNRIWREENVQELCMDKILNLLVEEGAINLPGEKREL